MEHIFYEFPVFIISDKKNKIFNDETGEYLAIKSASMIFVGDIINYFNHPAAAELLKEFNTLKFIVSRREFTWEAKISDVSNFPHTPDLFLEPYSN